VIREELLGTAIIVLSADVEVNEAMDLPAGGLCVPRTSSTSCDQAVFVDRAADASVSPDVISLKIDRFG